MFFNSFGLDQQCLINSATAEITGNGAK